MMHSSTWRRDRWLSKGKNWFIVPLDPSQGERYTEPVRDEDKDFLDHIYNMTVKEEDYVDPTTKGIMDWQCDSSCMTDSDDGLENWQNKLYELLGHRCARITKSLRWLGSQTRTYLFFMVWQTHKSLLCNSQSRYQTYRKWRLWTQYSEPQQPDGGMAIKSIFTVGKLVRIMFA